MEVIYKIFSPKNQGNGFAKVVCFESWMALHEVVMKTHFEKVFAISSIRMVYKGGINQLDKRY